MAYEIRFAQSAEDGTLGVFYEVDAQEPEVVNIVAIGIKKGNRLFVAGEEIHI